MRLVWVTKIIPSCAFLFLSVALAIGLFNRSEAQQEIGDCASATAKVFYGNGVLGDWDKAYIRMKELTRAIERDAPDMIGANQLCYSLAFNTSSGIFLDVFEAATQDLGISALQFWRIITGIEEMPAQFIDLATQIVSNANESAIASSQDLARHTSQYKNAIDNELKVVLVAHSQGNLFANKAYNQLTDAEKRSFGLISVATPSNFVADNGPHTTLLEDLVVVAIRTVKFGAGLPLPLLPNRTNLGNRDLLGHDFFHAYLVSGSNSRAKIVADIGSVLLELEQPGPPAEFTFFQEGEIGVPGDGLVISPIGGENPDRFDLVSGINLAEATNGLTVTVYSPEPLEFFDINFSFPGCSLFFGAGSAEREAPIVNGVSGLSSFYSTDILQGVVDRASELCGSTYSFANTEIVSIRVYKEAFIQTNRLDAAAFGFGENSFPD